MKLNIKDAVVIKHTSISKFGFIPIPDDVIDSFDADIVNVYKCTLTSDEFIEKYGFSPFLSILHGNVREVSVNTIHDYIDFESINITTPNKFKKSWKCFCGERHGLDYKQVLAHACPLESWKCLLIKLGNPNFGVIVNLRDYEKSL